jgi:hypothetical protein
LTVLKLVCGRVWASHEKQINLTLRSVSSLNNLQNSEMNFCEKYEVDMLKIVISIVSYTLWIISLFIWQYHNRSWKFNNFKF